MAKGGSLVFADEVEILIQANAILGGMGAAPKTLHLVIDALFDGGFTAKRVCHLLG